LYVMDPIRTALPRGRPLPISLNVAGVYPQKIVVHEVILSISLYPPPQTKVPRFPAGKVFAQVAL